MGRPSASLPGGLRRRGAEAWGAGLGKPGLGRAGGHGLREELQGDSGGPARGSRGAHRRHCSEPVVFSDSLGPFGRSRLGSVRGCGEPQGAGGHPAGDSSAVREGWAPVRTVGAREVPCEDEEEPWGPRGLWGTTEEPGGALGEHAGGTVGSCVWNCGRTCIVNAKIKLSVILPLKWAHLRRERTAIWGASCVLEQEPGSL